MTIEFPNTPQSGNSKPATKQPNELSSLEATIEKTNQLKGNPSPKTPQIDSLRASTSAETLSSSKQFELDTKTDNPSVQSTNEENSDQANDGFAHDFESFYDAIRDDDFVTQRLNLTFVPTDHSKKSLEAL